MDCKSELLLEAEQKVHEEILLGEIPYRIKIQAKKVCLPVPVIPIC